MSIPSRRLRWRRQRRLTQVLAITGVVCLGAYVSVSFAPALNRQVKAVVANTRGANAVTPVKLAATRPVYPYSIIKGGAYSRAELIAALDRDPVAARHYQGFRRSMTRMVSSPFTKPVYLSYRVGNAVYWTSRPVQLPRGETLLTDGQNFARARCGNRICETPQTPVNDTEPAPEILNIPLPPANEVAGLENWTEDRLITPARPIFDPLAPAPEIVSTVTPSASGGPLFSTNVLVNGTIALPLTPSPLLVYQPPIVPPVSAELWPPIPFAPITPLTPINPGPPPPTQTVPEPGLLAPILVACAAFAVSRRRRARDEAAGASETAA